jgi:hypothetical protein
MIILKSQSPDPGSLCIGMPLQANANKVNNVDLMLLQFFPGKLLQSFSLDFGNKQISVRVKSEHVGHLKFTHAIPFLSPSPTNLSFFIQ